MPAGNSNSAPSRNGQILLDTSAIIDGGIADITNTGFLYGTLVIPRFVYATQEAFTDDQVSDPEIDDRIRALANMLTRLSAAMP